jgi:fibronectin-binding autotransporter adhesin
MKKLRKQRKLAWTVYAMALALALPAASQARGLGFFSLAATTLSTGNTLAITNSTSSQISGGLTITGGTLEATGGARSFTNAISLNGSFGIGGASALTMNGTLLNSGNYAINVTNSAATTFAGNIVLSSGSSPEVLSFQGSGGVTVSGNISDGTGAGSSLVVAGTGKVDLTGANTFTGGVTVNGGGTLELDNESCFTGPSISTGKITLTGGSTLLFGANSQLSTGVNIVSGGGSFINVGNTIQNSLGTLTLTGTSTIIFSSTAGQTGSINFSASNAKSWTGTLYVDNWSSGDTLSFGTGSSGLGSGGPVFTNIVFVNPNGSAGDAFAGIGSAGKLSPVPEVGSFVYGGLLSGLVAFRHRRRLQAWLRNPSSAKAL